MNVHALPHSYHQLVVEHYEEANFENPSPLGNLHSTCVYAQLQCHEN